MNRQHHVSDTLELGAIDNELLSQQFSLKDISPGLPKSLGNSPIRPKTLIINHEEKEVLFKKSGSKMFKLTINNQSPEQKTTSIPDTLSERIVVIESPERPLIKEMKKSKERKELKDFITSLDDLSKQNPKGSDSYKPTVDTISLTKVSEDNTTGSSGNIPSSNVIKSMKSVSYEIDSPSLPLTIKPIRLQLSPSTSSKAFTARDSNKKTSIEIKNAQEESLIFDSNLSLGYLSGGTDSAGTIQNTPFERRLIGLKTDVQARKGLAHGSKIIDYLKSPPRESKASTLHEIQQEIQETGDVEEIDEVQLRTTRHRKTLRPRFKMD